MSLRLDGFNPLSYMGVTPLSVSADITATRAPTSNDSQNFNLMTRWLDTTTEDVWLLVSLSGGVATWVMITGGSGTVITLTGNSGGPVPALLGNINIVGDGTTITITGNPGTHTLTASAVGTGLIQTLTGDTGGAVHPTAGNINVFGGTAGRDINTSGSGSTLHVDLNNAITLGDLAVIPANSPALTITTGDINMALTGGDIHLPATDSAGAQGVITVYDSVGMTNVRVISWRGESNTFVGGNSGNFTLTVVSAVDNTGIGADSLKNLTTGNDNTCVGKVSGEEITTGYSNCGLGSGSLALATTALQNTCIGFNAGNVLTTSVDNVAVGAYALDAYTTGAANAGANTAVGTATLGALTTGIQNCCIGDSAAANLLTGSFNVIIGPSGTAANYTGAESSNVIINNDGVLGESNVIRIGNQGSGNDQQNKCWIAGIRGVTTGVNDAVPVLVDSTGQLGVTSSSKRYKENIQDLNNSDVIYNLRPVSFNYKNHSPESKSIGLIAEEVEQHCPQLVVYDHGQPETVKYHELPVYLLKEIQRLKARIDELEKRISP